MKKLFLPLLFIFIFSGNTYAQANWEGSIKKNEFDGKTYKFINGYLIKPDVPLDYPFEKLNMYPSIVCGVAPTIGFIFNDIVNLVGGKYLNDKTAEFNFRIKHGEQLENIKIEQDIAYLDSLFISFADSSRVYEWFKNEETIVLELKHYNDGVRYYKIDTKGFKKVHNDICM